MWFVEIRTAYLLVFRLSAAHIRSVTTDASALPTASVGQRSVQIYQCTFSEPEINVLLTELELLHVVISSL